MATRTNTVEYVGTAQTATLSASTVEEQTFTCYIPENSSRTFLSVYMEVYVMENNAATATRGSMTARMLGVGIDAVADSDVTVTDTITDTADQCAFVFKRDLTSYFTTNFTGTSHTVGLRFSFTQTGTNALTLNNVSMRLVVTYQYDDSAQTTRIKTVRIPLNSPTGALATTETEIGTNQIPNLSTFLPEASKTYRDIYFDVEAYGASNTTTDITVSLKTGTDATATMGVMEQANNTAVHWRYFWKRTDLGTSAAQAFKMWASSASCNHASITLVVTYEYDHSSDNAQIASLVIPAFGVRAAGRQSSTARTIWTVEVWVEEPATVTLAQSAVQVRFINAGSGSVSPRIDFNGTPTGTAYTGAYGSVGSGSNVMQHRIDSGGPNGDRVSLQRGRNIITFAFSSGGSAFYQSFSAAVILNYTHGKPTNGSGEANHTIKLLWQGDAADAGAFTLSSKALAIPETSYWLNGFGMSVESTYGPNSIGSVACARVTGDVPDWGSTTLVDYVVGPTSEISYNSLWASLAHEFFRFASDPYTRRMNPESSRDYQVAVGAISSNTVNLQAEVLATYHAITFSKTSAITGSGGGSVSLNLHYSGGQSLLLGAGEAVATASRTGDGNVTFVWYDNTEYMYAAAREDDTHVGRSNRFTFA